MKLGFITAICGEMTFEEVVDFAAAHGFACLEAASWPQGKAERRYAGVSHIDAERVLADAGYAERVAGYAATQPLIRENPEDPRNRRVSILLFNDPTQTPLDLQNATEGRIGPLKVTPLNNSEGLVLPAR